MRIDLSNLDPRAVFNLTGKFDPDEGAERLKQSAVAILMTCDTMGGSLADDETMRQDIAQATGLPSAKAYRLIRDVLVKNELLQAGNSPDGLIVMLTPKGRQFAQAFKSKLVAEGVMDAETEQPIEE